MRVAPHPCPIRFFRRLASNSVTAGLTARRESPTTLWSTSFTNSVAFRVVRRDRKSKYSLGGEISLLRHSPGQPDQPPGRTDGCYFVVAGEWWPRVIRNRTTRAKMESQARIQTSYALAIEVLD
jgi:hypothetical protein